MKVTQIAEDLNEIFKEIVGTYDPETNPDGIPLYKEDLSNFVDVGRKIQESSEFQKNDFDWYVGKLIDRIGKTIIVDKHYESNGPDLAVDSVEWGAIIQKVRIGEIDFEENPAVTKKIMEKAVQRNDLFGTICVSRLAVHLQIFQIFMPFMRLSKIVSELRQKSLLTV